MIFMKALSVQSDLNTIGNKGRSAWLYYFAYALWLPLTIVFKFANVADNIATYFDYGSVAITVFAASCLILKLLFDGQISRLPIIAALVAMLFSIIWLNAGLFSLVMLLLFIVSYDGVSITRLARITLISGFLSIAVIVLLWFFGVANDVILTRSLTGFERHSFGFTHPNALGMLLLNLSMVWVFLTKGEGIVKNLGLPVLIIIANFLFIDSRSSIVLIGTLIFVALFRDLAPQYVKRAFWKIPIHFLYVFIVALVLFSIIHFPQSNQALEIIDNLLSGRISLANGYYQYYGITLLGSDIRIGEIINRDMLSYFSTQRATVDCGYVYLLLSGGIASFISFVALYCWALRKIWLARNGILLAIAFVGLISGVLETSFLDLQTNFGLLIAGLALFGETSSATEHSRMSLLRLNRVKYVE